MRWRLFLLLLVSACVQPGEIDSSQVILLDLGEDDTRAAVLRGGGYRGESSRDACHQVDVDLAAGLSENTLQLIDASSGAVLWSAFGPGAILTGAEGAILFPQAQMTHSIVAPVAAVDSDGSGIVDRAYVADTGGMLWRISMPEGGRGYQAEISDLLATFTVEPLAVLGGEGTDNRQFIHRVDYVRSRDEWGDYDGIFLVSGNQRNPGDTEVQNYAYLVKDRHGQLVTHGQLPDITLACLHRDSTGCRNLDSRSGWKLALLGSGEEGSSRPLVSRGVVYFTTHAASAAEDSSCELPGDDGQLYAVNLADGSPATDHLLSEEVGPGLEPQRSLRLGQGEHGPVIPWRDQLLLPGATGDRAILRNPVGPLRWRIYWREEGVDEQ